MAHENLRVRGLPQDVAKCKSSDLSERPSFFSVLLFSVSWILMIFSFTGACTAPTAMIGPAYTLSSTGNIFQAGLSYSSNELITYYTEKTPLENLKEISQKERKKFNNIKKQTLESEDFFALIQSKIKKTSKILKIANQ